MEKKLQELTEKIYSEGVEKARSEAENILKDAEKKAGSIIAKANEERDQIIETAKKRSEEIIRNGQSEMKLASNQAVSEVKQKLTDIVTSKAVSESVSPAVSDKEFIKKIIETAVKNFFSEGASGMDLELTLPGSEKNELAEYFKAKAKSLLDGGLNIITDPEMESGFKIGPADGSYKLSFTESDFINFFKNYMRPKTTELLFGGK
ncbi:MAG: V-type ATP synthase subunit E [Candidatus Delongbacteria bacterium]|nr:V-type ATP synthase subunit E [Candidatus Delongbacteria bacterium]